MNRAVFFSRGIALVTCTAFAFALWDAREMHLRTAAAEQERDDALMRARATEHHFTEVTRELNELTVEVELARAQNESCWQAFDWCDADRLARIEACLDEQIGGE